MAAVDLQAEEYRRLKAALRPLGLYRLDGATLVDAELKAYAAGLKLFWEAAAAFTRECFTATAEEEGLTLREALCGGTPAGLTVEQRRERLLYRTAVTADDCSREGVARALVAAGLHADVVEQPDEALYVNVHAPLGDTALCAALEAAAQEFLPAHIEAVFDFRPLSWDAVEAMELIFSAMDARGLTWNQIDHYGEE
jgi:hypothetical protein